ncbi:MAG: lysoplasmalogenase [Anaerolineales bacterium]|nr:lysoplasmalogenase [Anaerolineales bacterium]
MIIFLIAAFVFAALEALALQKNWFKLEVFAKPGVMIALFLWLWTSAGLGGALLWFGLGILLSLVGDVLLMISLDRLFLAGLASFLLAHIAYIIGFNTPLPGMNFFGIVFAVIIGLGGARIIRRILDRLPAAGQGRMRAPIIIYSFVISIMLLSAMIKLTDISWDAGAAALVSVGAFLFYISDIILAWNKFVAPIQHGRIYNIAAYHLGQIALISGVLVQFSA